MELPGLEGLGLELPDPPVGANIDADIIAACSGETKTGKIGKVNQGKFGFIAQDEGGDEMFVIPGACPGFGSVIPMVGTAVMYEVTVDQKTGRPRAENVRPLEGAEYMQDVLPPLAEGERAGSVVRVMAGATSGFIEQDCGEENMLVVPRVCAPFGYTIPPPGTRVIYTVAIDPTEGGPVAKDVRPEGSAAAVAPADESSGTFVKDQGKFGFIQQDSGEDNMFVLPKSCEGFGGALPPLGTRVVYQLVLDAKTGRPRADHVKPEGGSAWPSAEASWSSWSSPANGWGGEGAKGGWGGNGDSGAKGGWGPAARPSGTFARDSGSFGFIEQDGGQENMFVMPKSCEGGALPPVGTRVSFDVVADAKTGRPRADNVTPEEPDPWDPNTVHKGTIVAKRKETDNFGFIEQDSGGDKMFCLPRSCTAWGNEVPPAGTRVQYKVVPDSKTGRPRADDVQPLDDETMAEETAAERVAAASMGLPYGWDAGTVSDITNAEKFAFITPDTGGSNMFVMPRSCTGFNGVIPQLHTRVIYRVTIDSRTGRPRAEEVHPEGARVKPVGVDPSKGKGGKGGKSKEGPMLFGQKLYGPPALMSQTSRAAALYGGKGKEGPQAAPQFGPAAEKFGASVEGPSWAGASDQEFAGSIARISGSFGFIDQDCGGENMFVLPKACEEFGKEIPPVGTRVLYSVIADVKTGRPRADKVRPENGGWRPGPRPATKGTAGKGGEDYLAVLAGRSTSAYGPASGPYGSKGRGQLVPGGGPY